MTSANPAQPSRASGYGRASALLRVATLIVFVCAVVLVATLVFSGGSGYRYTLKFENVSLMVPGNLVMVGGHPVGSIKAIELSEDIQAAMEVELDEELREGST
ncbi:MAG: MlaD family protein, partial [Solirubrobacterales bacterium]